MSKNTRQHQPELIARIETGREAGLRSHSLTREESDRMLRTVSCLYEMADFVKDSPDYEASFEVIRDSYGRLAAAHNEKAAHTRSRMDNMFRFAEKCWGEDKEMLMAATELTADPDCVSFISTYGCDEYFRRAASYADVIGYKVNKGKGYALKRGFEYIGNNLCDEVDPPWLRLQFSSDKTHSHYLHIMINQVAYYTISKSRIAISWLFLLCITN